MAIHSIIIPKVAQYHHWVRARRGGGADPSLEGSCSSLMEVCLDSMFDWGLSVDEEPRRPPNERLHQEEENTKEEHENIPCARSVKLYINFSVHKQNTKEHEPLASSLSVSAEGGGVGSPIPKLCQ
jgi:hypothetical protein